MKLSYAKVVAPLLAAAGTRHCPKSLAPQPQATTPPFNPAAEAGSTATSRLPKANALR